MPANLHCASSKQFLLPSQIPKGTDVGDIQRETKLVFRADLAERKAPILERNSATGSVIAHLDELILQNTLPHIVSDARACAPPAPVRLAVSRLKPNLILHRLQHGVVRRQDGCVVDGKLRHREIEIFGGVNFKK